jgi:hypothetical protein
MRKPLLSLCLGLISFSVMANKKIEVREANENIGGASHNALVVMIYVEDQEYIEKHWKSKLKDMDGKISTKKEIFADDCKVKAMGDNTFDVYSRAELVKGEGVKLIVGVDLGGAYLSSSEHGEKFKYFKDVVYQFAVEVTKKKIGEEVEEQEKKLSKMEDEQKDLEQDNGSLKSDIESYKEKIKKAEEDIKKNEEEQKKKKEEIEAQKKAVQLVKDKLSGVK